jgi:vacuolar protein sorting-associated protein 52
MWLDRLSGHSTPSNVPPQPHNRSYSPLPRRSSHLAPPTSSKRPGFSPQSSTLSLVSNDSTTSLLESSKKTNGSALRQSTTIADHPEPLEVLKKLLGAQGKDANIRDVSEDGVGDLDPDEELDFSGLSLRELAEPQPSESDGLQSHVLQTIEECMYAIDFSRCFADGCMTDERDKAKFEDLHRSIRACDDVLNSVEINLTKFQNDLGAVSAEIETLQARSMALSIRLENRKVVEKGLGPIVEEITVSPAVVRKISEGMIDEAWVKALGEVEKRSRALDLKSKEQRNIKGINDLRPLLNHLVDKVSQHALHNVLH